MRAVLLFLGIVTSGLSAGLFFGWAVSVIPGHARVSDRTYVSSMQAINRAIINPLFLLVFLGAAVALVAAAAVHFGAGYSRRGGWLTVASAVYVLGVLGVTAGGNIPLNDALAEFELDTADDDEVARQRRDYETAWNRWHAVRTVASTLAVSAAALAAVVTDAG